MAEPRLSAEALNAVVTWAAQYGQRYFGLETGLREELRAYLAGYLYDGTQPIWGCLIDCLITESEARNLLLQWIHGFFMYQVVDGSWGISEDGIEDIDSLDLALFGRAAEEIKLGLRC